MKKSLRMKFMFLLFALVVGYSNVWATDVTYTVSSKTAVTTTGTAPSGSSASYSQTYNTACQATSGNSLTLTLSGYEGYKITGITLSMKSNSSKGAGSLSVVAGSTTIASIEDSKFNTSNWYGAWSTSYVDIDVSMTDDSYEIQEDDEVVITISATENSLYCQSYTLTYDEANDDRTPTTIIINSSGINNNMYDDNTDGGVIAATIKAGETTVAGSVTWSSSVTSVATINASSGAITLVGLGTTTLTASYAGNVTYKPSTGTYNLTVIKVNPNKTTIWSEDFTGYAANDVPDEGIYSYTCVDGSSDTKVYEQDLAGGSSPELLVGNTGGSFTATIPLGYCCSGDLTLTFRTNNTNIAVSSTTTGVTVTGTIVSGANTITISDVTTDMANLVIVFSNDNSKNVRLDNIVLKAVVEVPVNGSNVITSDVTIPYGATSNVSSTVIIPSTQTLTINGILNVTGTLTNNGTATNLVINDGGQLIYNGSVAATFKKTMTAPSKTDVYGWELISSPVHDGTGTTIAVENVTNLTTGTYDMFAYNEAAHTWYNQKAGNPHAFTTLNNGEGYMYRNNAQELSFVGNTNSGDVTRTLSYTAGDLAGFHLVGNPYTHSITVDDNVSLLGDGDVALESGKQLSGYYLLTNGGSEWTSELGKTTNIANKQGFLIQIPAEAKKIKFTEAAAKRNSANTDNIMFAVSNSQFNDVTYALFDEALPLNKIDHRNPEVPMLYVNQDGQDYAIATMSDDTKAFNLNFKAGTIGKYTLSYKAEGDFDYIHVIDRLTGEDVDILLEGEYSFIGAPNDNENRFIVKLGYNAANETSDDIFAYHNGNDVIVNGEGELQVFDVTGRMVATQHVNGVETINLNSNGVYIFRLNEKVQKIIVR